jgi:hypothetical protein
VQRIIGLWLWRGPWQLDGRGEADATNVFLFIETPIILESRLEL